MVEMITQHPLPPCTLSTSTSIYRRPSPSPSFHCIKVQTCSQYILLLLLLLSQSISPLQSVQLFQFQEKKKRYEEDCGEAEPARRQGEAEGDESRVVALRDRVPDGGHEGQEADGHRGRRPGGREQEAAQVAPDHRVGRAGEGGEEGGEEEGGGEEGGEEEGRGEEGPQQADRGPHQGVQGLQPIHDHAIPRLQRRRKPQRMRHLLRPDLSGSEPRSRRGGLNFDSQLFIYFCLVKISFLYSSLYLVKIFIRFL